jgi:hypothetical protein
MDQPASDWALEETTKGDTRNGGMAIARDASDGAAIGGGAACVRCC